MSDINVVYAAPIWKAVPLIDYLASVMSNVLNRLTVNLGIPPEIYEIVSNGYNRGYTMKHTSNTANIRLTRIDRRDQLHGLLTRLIANERFSSFTYIPTLGNTMTIFRHQITFDNTNDIDRRRFAEYGKPFSCCDRLDGCCTPSDNHMEHHRTNGISGVSGGGMSHHDATQSVYRQDSMRAPIQSRIPINNTSGNAMNFSSNPSGGNGGNIGMSRR